ncbi:hypothetical protein, partial [Nocardia mangyaensis]|uniref:hypothetical protein n=1 Tax=Nocardia mangyaensis TaxID=2213200 RepID=UPI00267542D8
DIIKFKPANFYIFNFSLQALKDKNYFQDYNLHLYKRYPSLEEVLQYFNKDNYTIIMTVNGDGFDVINGNIKVLNTLKLLGSTFKDFCYGSSYILIIRNGRVIKEVASVKDSVSISIALMKDKKYWTNNYKNNAIFLDISSSGYGKNCQRPSKKEKLGIYSVNNNIVINDKPIFLEIEG